MSHYYTRDGKAAHTQPCKSKTAKKPTRPTTTRDAITLGLLPSVSGIADVLNKPALYSYITREAIGLCYDLPPHPLEGRDEYVKALSDKAKDEGSKAADAGTLIHAAIEAELTGQEWGHDALVTLASGEAVPMGKMVFPAMARMDALGIKAQQSEKVLVNRFVGYAGTTDVIFSSDNEYGILDFKSRKTTPGKPVDPYETQPCQIAAYVAAHWQTEDFFKFGEKMCGYNLYISTTEIGRIEVVRYDYKELDTAYRAFLNMMNLWIWQNKYNPAF
jgi:hypothetical protein